MTPSRSGRIAMMLAGVLPTPAVALLALDLGAVISASHNPPEYNGVKFFDSEGRKLTDESEEEIEALLDTPPATEPGAIDRVGIATDSYLEHIRMGIEHLLHFPRIHVVSTADDHVCLAFDEEEVSIVVDVADVARA